MTRWTAIVPVKPWAGAKTRLALTASQRHRLARAFTWDLLEVLSATPAVGRTVVVTDEPDLTPFTHPEVVILREEGGASTGSLDAAIATGVAWARRHHGADPLVVLPADLPCLTATDLTTALARLAQLPRAFVPDMSDHGTTLTAASDPRTLLWAYGGASAARHQQLGLTPVTDVPETVRHDVDTVAALTRAAELGFAGQRTREVHRSLAPAGGR